VIGASVTAGRKMLHAGGHPVCAGAIGAGLAAATGMVDGALAPASAIPSKISGIKKVRHAVVIQLLS
jgi:hypothetical protein